LISVPGLKLLGPGSFSWFKVSGYWFKVFRL